MRILGIDFGLQRIGLSLAEDGFPQPLGVIANKPKVIKRINQICQTNRTEKIVIGRPEGKINTAVVHFSRQLKKVTGLPVDFEDETLTTKEAVAKMRELGKKRKARRQKQDAFAAAIILQNYLAKKSLENV